MHKPENGLIQFAKRRPDWELRSLHQDLMLTNALVCLDTRTASTRKTCPQCNKSRALYCYDCLIPMLDPSPRVTLPFQLSIISHSQEQSSKNTGVHAVLLAPGQASIHSLDACPPFDASRAVVLYPSSEAIEVGQLQPDSIDRCFVIDSKWKASEKLIQHPALSGVRRVRLKEARSAFWRFHTAGVGEEGLCTIECVYFFLKTLADQGKISPPLNSALEARTSAAPSQQQQVHRVGSDTDAEVGRAGDQKGNQGTPGDSAASVSSIDAQQEQSGMLSRDSGVYGKPAGVCSENVQIGAPDIEGLQALESGAQGESGRAQTNNDVGSLAACSSYDLHAFDDLLWYFCCQHNYVSMRAAQRLEEHTAKRLQSPPTNTGQTHPDGLGAKRRKK